MKFGLDIFPKGTFAGQQSDGAYIDETLAKNLDIIAEAMHKDIQPTIIISGDNQSGSGKSTLLTQIGCYLTWKINQIYKLNNTFTNRNINFKIDKMIKEAPELCKEQPYSVICLDEPDDMLLHQSKNRAFEIKKAVRKLRQLNPIMIQTSHSFFELPKFYALNRSQALLNVRFEGKFDRGFFKFYGPKSKKLLYLRGRKEWDYEAYKSDFDGRFFASYCFFPDCAAETTKYKTRKYKDMMDEIEGNNKQEAEVTEKQERVIKIKIFKQLHVNLPEITLKKLSEAFGVSVRSGLRWLHGDERARNNEDFNERDAGENYTNNIIKDNLLDDEEENTELK